MPHEESIALYKLIALYILSRVDTPLPSGIISDYITGHGYTHFFNLQNALGELLQSDLIREDATYHVSYYSITDSGRETLELLDSHLSPRIQKEVDEYLTERKYEILDRTSLVSDYHLTGGNFYNAVCTIRDGKHTMFRLEIEVPTEEDAQRICDNCQDGSEQIYEQAIQILLR